MNHDRSILLFLLVGLILVLASAIPAEVPDVVEADFISTSVPRLGKAVSAGSGKVVPAGPGKAVPAGRGTGVWRTYDVTDGLANPNVNSIFRDREGCLWFGTLNGVSRFDGQIWTTFTTQDGLAYNGV
ncbi:MAG: two-component regulator propeller domain-containing protein, partial [Candidatus Latescibacteria bacterium]|nr:two-component regulator propeller domain-containing protein [Candidatus Latescibacterota bacterium]